MTAEEIRKAQPEVEPLEKPVEYNPGGRTRVATLGIKEFTIAGETFSVHFLLDESGRLDQVILTPIGSVAGSGLFNQLEKLLTEKYGSPALVQNNKTGEGLTLLQSKSDSWNLTDLTITLNYIILVGIDSETVKLIYSEPAKRTLDKL